ncbi:Guanine nucleotide-binding protein subunit beta-like protein [Thelohanellus kitauei]|uniref:Guanine nucleotide-binding protein subunit beta-like protein n=1 Tax=Thelohanellus kitauei TaxID=669202 RepID=A0A0C2MWI1_THEKT|nr:Guanine nucleotide-binding protein subunit beta-like protein [Thelohanellus kitauei]
MSSNNIETSYKGKQIGALRRHICTITKICVLPTEGLKIVSSSKDHNIMIWNLEFEQDKISGKMIRHLYGHVDEVTDMSINANGKLLVSASVDKTLILWDLIRGEILTTMEGHKGPVTCCWINAETPHVISGSLDGKVRVWSMDGKLLSESPASLEEHGVTGVAVLQLDQSKN